MARPWIEIKQSIGEVWLWLNKDKAETIYEGPLDPKVIRDFLNDILKKHPEVKVRTEIQESKDCVFIFRQYRNGINTGSVVRTKAECPNPFDRRKTYAMAFSDCTIGFDTLAL